MDMNMGFLTAMALLSCGVVARLSESVTVVATRQGIRRNKTRQLYDIYTMTR